MVIYWFSVNLVRTGAVTSNSRIQKFLKCGVQGAEAVDIIIGDHLVHFSA